MPKRAAARLTAFDPAAPNMARQDQDSCRPSPGGRIRALGRRRNGGRSRRASHLTLGALTALAFAVMPWNISSAATIEGITLPDDLAVGRHTLPLVACGLREFLFADLYAVGIYAPERISRASDLEGKDIPRAVTLKVTYGGQVPGQVPQEWRKEFNDEARRQVVATVSRLYKTLESGDVVTLAYAPGEGTTTIMKNNQVTMVEKGTGPMQAIIDILIGREAASKSLRREMLKGPC